MQFSVIVPVYKVEPFLNRCIDSILSQTFTDFEVILVDDGSPDRCPQICDYYREKDSRVRVIHKPNGGLVSARNAGIFAARGDYITYVDGDDWAAPAMLAFVHQKLAEAPFPLDMVLFAAESVYSDHIESLDYKVADGYYDRARLEKEIFPYLFSDRRRGFLIGSQIQAHTWNKPCRRELQLKHYVRDERIRTFTDVPMTYECLLDCQNVYICNEHLYFYNQMNEQSLLTLGKKNYLTESFGHLVAYMQGRLTGLSPSINSQLNDYPAHLIIRTAIKEVKYSSCFLQAVRSVRTGLDASGMLQYVRMKGLPLNPRILILLFKLHFDHAAMLLCAVKARKSTI